MMLQQRAALIRKRYAQPPTFQNINNPVPDPIQLLPSTNLNMQDAPTASNNEEKDIEDDQESECNQEEKNDLTRTKRQLRRQRQKERKRTALTQ